jgi:hypothetical protein
MVRRCLIQHARSEYIGSSRKHILNQSLSRHGAEPRPASRGRPSWLRDVCFQRCGSRIVGRLVRFVNRVFDYCEVTFASILDGRMSMSQRSRNGSPAPA